jgi:hypothetical protein
VVHGEEEVPVLDHPEVSKVMGDRLDLVFLLRAIAVGGVIVAVLGIFTAWHPFYRFEWAQTACEFRPVPANFDGSPEGITGSPLRAPIGGSYCTYRMRDGYNLIVPYPSFWGIGEIAVGVGLIAVSGASVTMLRRSWTAREDDLTSEQ